MVTVLNKKTKTGVYLETPLLVGRIVSRFVGGIVGGIVGGLVGGILRQNSRQVLPQL